MYRRRDGCVHPPRIRSADAVIGTPVVPPHNGQIFGNLAMHWSDRVAQSVQSNGLLVTITVAWPHAPLRYPGQPRQSARLCALHNYAEQPSDCRHEALRRQRVDAMKDRIPDMSRRAEQMHRTLAALGASVTAELTASGWSDQKLITVLPH